MIVAVYEDEFTMVKAMEEILEKKFRISEVYTPYPVHEVFHALKRRSRLQIAGYFYGLFGAVAVLAFLYWTSVIDWPIIYGGKPFNSFPSFIVVTIVLTIFIVTIASLATFSLRARMWPGKNHKIWDHRATDDRFIIILSEKDNKDHHDWGSVKGILTETGATEVNEN
jgi:hypothetical protein